MLLGACISSRDQESRGGVVGEKVFHVAAEVAHLVLRVGERVGNVCRRIVVKGAAGIVVVITIAAACAPIGRSTIHLREERVDVRIDLACNENIVGLVGLRDNVGIEGSEALLHDTREIGDISRNLGIRSEHEEISYIASC